MTSRSRRRHPSRGAGLPYVFPWGTFTVNAAGSLLLGVL
ncbi:CrcB protein, partial [Streptomyces sp. NPDC052071]